MEKQIEILRFVIKSCERESIGIFNNLLNDLNLTANQAEVIEVLNSYGPMSVKNLGDLLICERKSPSRLVQSLIKKGLLCKTTSKEDKRISLISLSKQGKKLLPEIKKRDAQFNKIIEQHLSSSDEVKELTKVLISYLKGTESYDKLQRRFGVK